jgi:short-subunit dehydrogenase/predicted ester cyclase
VNNSGIAIAAPLEYLPLDELRRQLEVNLVAQLAVTQALLPALRAARGRIVFVGSIAGRSALPFLGAYAASKFALEALADSLRVELAPDGIQVAIAEPGTIATAIWTKPQPLVDLPEEGAKRYGPRIARFRSVATARSAKAAPAEAVAAAVEHALTAPRPRTRYVVGRDAKLRAALERLPDRARDRVIARALLGARARRLAPGPRTSRGGATVSATDNKDLIRRYIEAVDANRTSDWSILDDYIAEDFVAHNPPVPGVSLDRNGMKQAAEIFRVATPGRHEITMQVAEGDLVVSHIVGEGVHEGELLGIPATKKEIRTEGIAIHRVRDGKIVEYWAVTDVARVLQQVGVLPERPS